jgi:hypothetical protein
VLDFPRPVLLLQWSLFARQLLILAKVRPRMPLAIQLLYILLGLPVEAFVTLVSVNAPKSFFLEITLAVYPIAMQHLPSPAKSNIQALDGHSPSTAFQSLCHAIHQSLPLLPQLSHAKLLMQH